MRDKRKILILSSWTKPPFEAPQSHLAPIQPPDKRNKQKARQKEAPLPSFHPAIEEEAGR
jgi:hypothetical protein